MPLFANYIEVCPCFDIRLPYNQVQLNTRFVENQVITDQTLKNKICMELDFQEIEFHAKKKKL